MKLKLHLLKSRFYIFLLKALAKRLEKSNFNLIQLELLIQEKLKSLLEKYYGDRALIRFFQGRDVQNVGWRV